MQTRCKVTHFFVLASAHPLLLLSLGLHPRMHFGKLIKSLFCHRKTWWPLEKVVLNLGSRSWLGRFCHKLSLECIIHLIVFLHIFWKVWRDLLRYWCSGTQCILQNDSQNILRTSTFAITRKNHFYLNLVFKRKYGCQGVSGSSTHCVHIDTTEINHFASAEHRVHRAFGLQDMRWCIMLCLRKKGLELSSGVGKGEGDTGRGGSGGLILLLPATVNIAPETQRDQGSPARRDKT